MNFRYYRNMHCVALSILVAVPLTCLSQEFGKSSAAAWLSSKDIKWSSQTNGFWTGVNVSVPLANTVKVLILSTNPPEGMVYVLPPYDTFQRLELRDTNGTMIPPLYGSKGDLPPRIPAKRMPHNRDGLFSGHGTIYKYFMLGPRGPGVFNDIRINDLYRIQEEGEYTLRICPVIYKFETNREYLDRIDWPSVCLKMRLQPSE